jgi:ABC-type proline/glycine betaine transport system ATPase subunit
MTNVIHLNPESEKLNAQQAVKSAIRQQLAAAVGTLQREETSDADILFVLHRMEEAANLVRVVYELRGIREDLHNV